MSNELSYDPDDPPADPPVDADPLLWRLAYALHRAHRARGDGWCECRQFAPCEDRRLAEIGLAAACGATAAAPAYPNNGHW